jgi:hypothetical protein
MSEQTHRLRYDPREGPERSAWLGAPEAERTLAVRRWLKHNDLPFPCCVPRSADQWREVEDQLASGSPPQTRQLMDRLRAEGVERLVALWAVAEALSSERYQRLERMARQGEDVDSFDVGRLFEPCDSDILPAAFEAAAGGFGAAHETVIDYYHTRFDPEGSMPFAQAAGFCFGCAASPRFIRNHTLYEHMFGNEVAEETPVYLPVADAYRELFRFVSDAVFEQDDPIPPSVRPPRDPQACFDSTFSEWCRGFIATQPVVAPGWEGHLADHPGLNAEYLAIVDTLRFFASREEAERVLAATPGTESLEAAIPRMHAALGPAIRRLFRLAHPVVAD